jgi:hypothetical protein
MMSTYHATSVLETIRTAIALDAKMRKIATARQIIGEYGEGCLSIVRLDSSHSVAMPLEEKTDLVSTATHDSIHP